MLPLADYQPQRRSPIINATLIVLKVAVYALLAHVGGFVFGPAATSVLVHSRHLSPSDRTTGWGTT